MAAGLNERALDEAVRQLPMHYLRLARDGVGLPQSFLNFIRARYRRICEEQRP